MNFEIIREYCLSKAHSSEKFPFDEHTLVFYVVDKMFALTSLDEPDQIKINLKCDPEWAIQLREENEAIIPGYHMNKRHWNTVLVEELNWEFVKELIDHSYLQVIKSFSNKKQKEYNF